MREDDISTADSNVKLHRQNAKRFLPERHYVDSKIQLKLRILTCNLSNITFAVFFGCKCFSQVSINLQVQGQRHLVLNNLISCVYFIFDASNNPPKSTVCELFFSVLLSLKCLFNDRKD